MNEQLYHLRNTETGEIVDTRYLNAELAETTNRRATGIHRFSWRWLADEPAPTPPHRSIKTMFNPADFDALATALEERYDARPNTPDMQSERAMLLYAVETTRHLAESFGMMAPEPAQEQETNPSPFCSKCGLAPELPYSSLCKTCYAAFIGEIEQRRAQKATAIVDASDDALEFFA